MTLNEEIPVQKKLPVGRLILLAAVDVGLLATYYYLINHPDAVARIHMRAALITKRSCLAASDKLRKVSDDAGTYYNQLRNVSV